MKLKTNRLSTLLSVAACFLAFLFVSSCNSKSDDDGNEMAVTSAAVAIKDFSLQANAKVMSNLDSVFFSIDLKEGVVFNADSLPMGTDVSGLIPVITFINRLSKAELIFKDKEGRSTTVDYLTNPSDTIDFTNPVTLNVTALDGISKFTYTLKVNVHKQNPDSLVWDNMAYSILPSRGSEPVRQKTVKRNNSIISLIEEMDGSYTLASTSTPETGDWKKQEVAFSFDPEIRTLNSTEDFLWILSREGQLFYSADGTVWTSTGENWKNIIGPYDNLLLGIKESGGILKHTCYPSGSTMTETEVTNDFPIEGFSALGIVDSDWASSPTVIMTGGVTRDGTLTGATWAFDGSSWERIDNNSVPPVEGAWMTQYIVTRALAPFKQPREFQAWILSGGLLADGSFNKNVYVSLDNGVNWKKASESLQLPEYFPELSNADAITWEEKKEVSLSEAWTKMSTPQLNGAMRLAYQIEGTDIIWDCPYIYIFGGDTADGKLSAEIWKGVITRLSFKPLF